MVEEYFLGFDLSTQAIKVFIADRDLNLHCEVCVKYDKDILNYKNKDILQKSGNSVTSSVAMWIEALDLALEKTSTLVDMDLVVGIGGCAQQHGTVYTGQDFLATLQNLNPAESLHTQLSDKLSVVDSPIWLDSSTEDYCSRLEEKIGIDDLCKKTGSRAHARFSVHHIHKLVNEDPETYRETERVLLISNFLSTLLAGDYVPMDFSDGSGMNLLDIIQKRWIPEIGGMYGGVDVCEKLGQPKPTLRADNEEPTRVSDYLTTRYGVNKDCHVTRFTGDNPATLVGMCCGDEDLILSLGTSDVLIGVSSHVTPSPDIHVFCNPLNQHTHMFIICYKNGSLVREELMKNYCEGSWDKYNEIISSVPRDDQVIVGNYLPQPETCPAGLTGHFCSTDPDASLFSHPPATIVRTVTKGQFLSKRNDIAAAGFSPSRAARLIVVGGGSVNNTLLTLISNVFGMDVYRMSSGNAAARGAALLAYADVKGVESMRELVRRTEIELVAKTDLSEHEKYCGLRETYVKLQEKCMKSRDM
ncbi:hypothetical protein ACHWQZ_G000057 [Mnemiopsis leidyi]